MIRLTGEQWERIRDHFPEETIIRSLIESRFSASVKGSFGQRNCKMRDNRISVGPQPVGDHHRGKNRTLRDSMSVPQLVFLPRAVIAGNAAIFSPRWTIKAS